VPREVPVTVRATTAADAQRAMAVIAPIDLSTVFHRYGPLPAVRGVREQTGAWDHPGATRVVELSDGGEVRERLTAYEPGRHFAYELTPLRGVLRLIATGARGAWSFTPAGGDPGGCEIAWTYTFLPRPGAGMLVRLGLAPLWRRYAARALARCAAAAEAR
jgi:hypothetical protein